MLLIQGQSSGPRGERGTQTYNGGLGAEPSVR